jgi:hypothetical protein
MVLAFRNNHDAALPIEPGRIIEVSSLPEDERFVLVAVDGQEFHAFASDVPACCERLRGVARPRRRTHGQLAPLAAA